MTDEGRRVCRDCGASYEGRLRLCPLDGAPLDPVDDPHRGRLIAGRYLVRNRIGRGSSALVYRGRHEAAGRDVAIKIFIPRRDDGGVQRARFVREARIANRIKHPNVIDITDVGTTEDGITYLVTEFLHGGPLRTGQPREPAESARLILEVARALEAAHGLDVVHRDIKPRQHLCRPARPRHRAGLRPGQGARRSMPYRKRGPDG